MINVIVIDFWFSWNFASMKNVNKKCNLMVDLSKFTFNKNILNEVAALFRKILGKILVILVNIMCKLMAFLF